MKATLSQRSGNIKTQHRNSLRGRNSDNESINKTNYFNNITYNGCCPFGLLERKVTYIADFMYEENGKAVVEDTKGLRTKEYVIKRKLMLYKYGIRIEET